MVWTQCPSPGIRPILTMPSPRSARPLSLPPSRSPAKIPVETASLPRNLSLEMGLRKIWRLWRFPQDLFHNAPSCQAAQVGRRRLCPHGRLGHHAGPARRQHGSLRFPDREVPQADHPLHVPHGSQPGSRRGARPGGLPARLPLPRNLPRRGSFQHLALSHRHQSRRQSCPRHSLRALRLDRVSR